MRYYSYGKQMSEIPDLVPRSILVTVKTYGSSPKGYLDNWRVESRTATGNGSKQERLCPVPVNWQLWPPVTGGEGEYICEPAK